MKSVEQSSTKTVSVRVPVELLEEAAKVAAQEDRTMTSLIVHALRQHVKDRGKPN